MKKSAIGAIFIVSVLFINFTVYGEDAPIEGKYDYAKTGIFPIMHAVAI